MQEERIRKTENRKQRTEKRTEQRTKCRRNVEMKQSFCLRGEINECSVETLQLFQLHYIYNDTAFSRAQIQLPKYIVHDEGH